MAARHPLQRHIDVAFSPCFVIFVTVCRQQPRESAMIPDLTIDCVHLLCPLPVLKARKSLISMKVGAVLCVRATDPMAAIDLPHFCAEGGHSLIASGQDGDVQVYFIRRGETPLTAP